METKRLQSNFTTPEQAKRLLELGVPENTADCFYYDWAWFPEFEHYGKQINVINWNDFNEENRLREVKVFPCWTVGRLIEIYCTIIGRPKVVLYSTDIYTEAMVGLIDAAVQRGFDFSKLNELC